MQGDQGACGPLRVNQGFSKSRVARMRLERYVLSKMVQAGVGKGIGCVPEFSRRRNKSQHRH
jgi:hypothetical protein